MIEYRWS